VKAFTTDAPEHIREMVQEIHIPTGAGEAKGHDFDI
jgi:hypothetical protein